MPAKKKSGHNTRSVIGSRTSSPLTIKLKNNLAVTKKKLVLKSIVKVVNNNKQTKKKRVSFHEDVPAHPPVDITPPRQTAFTDAMEKWRQSVICAVNSMPYPSVESTTDATAQAAVPNNNVLKQVVGKGNTRNQAVLVAVHNPFDLVAPQDSDSRPSQGHSDGSSQPGQQQVPQDDLEVDNINIGEVLNMFEVDNLPPLPSGRPDHGPVAAESAPQAALDMLTACDTPGKGF